MREGPGRPGPVRFAAERDDQGSGGRILQARRRLIAVQRARAATLEPVTSTRPDEDARFVIQRELSLLQLEVRDSAGQVEALLHPDFTEVTAAGRRSGRRQVIAARATRQLRKAIDNAAETSENGAEASAGEPATASGLSAIRLSSTVILVSYLSEQDGEQTRRSSLWLKTGPGWRLYFHQATPVTAR